MGKSNAAMVFCCFSDKPLTKEECQDNRMKGDGQAYTDEDGKQHKQHPYCRTDGRSFQTTMCKAPCNEPVCCCLTFWSMTYGTSWCTPEGDQRLEPRWYRGCC